MSEFENIEQEAKDHSQQVDAGIQKADQEADQESGGRDKNLIDKGASEAEREVGGSQANDPNAGQSPPA